MVCLYLAGTRCNSSLGCLREEKKKKRKLRYESIAQFQVSSSLKTYKDRCFAHRMMMFGAYAAIGRPRARIVEIAHAQMFQPR